MVNSGVDRDFNTVLSEIEKRSFSSADWTCFTSVNHSFRVINYEATHGVIKDITFDNLQDFVQRKKSFL